MVEIYTRRRCSLCDEMRQAVEQMIEGLPVELRMRFIEESEDLWSRFRYDVPVLAVDGEVQFRHRLDKEAFEALLRARGMAIAQRPAADAQMPSVLGKRGGLDGNDL